MHDIIRAASSEFVSSSIPSWQILNAHAQPFRGAWGLAFCLRVPLASLLVWASSGGSGETARMRRLAWTFAARIGDKYQIRLTRPITLSDATSYDKQNYCEATILSIFVSGSLTLSFNGFYFEHAKPTYLEKINHIIVDIMQFFSGRDIQL